MTPAERIAELFRTHRQYLGEANPKALDMACHFEDELGELLCELLGRHDPIPVNDSDQTFDYCSRCDRLTKDIGLERDPENPGKYRQVTK